MDNPSGKSISQVDERNSSNLSFAITSTSNALDECKPPEYSDSSLTVDKPHDHDILFARGHNVEKHIGSVFLRQLVMRRKQHVKNGTHPSHVLVTAHDIFNEIKRLQPTARFLMHAPYDSSKWNIVSDSTAVREICNLLDELGGEESLPSNKFVAGSELSLEDVGQEDDSIHSHSTQNTQNTTRSNISRLIKSATMIDRAKHQGSDKGNEDRATLELIQRYHDLISNKNIATSTRLSGINESNAQLNQYNTTYHHQIGSNQMPQKKCLNITENATGPNMQNNKLDYTVGQITLNGKYKSSEYHSTSSSSHKRLDHNKKKKLSSKRSKVSLPKMDSDEFSVHSNQQSVYSNQQSVHSSQRLAYSIKQSMDSTHSLRKPACQESEVRSLYLDKPKEKNSERKDKTRKERTNTELSAKRKKAEKNGLGRHHQEVIMPLSYIGNSFLNNPYCSAASKSIFEEIATLDQRGNENPLLYLPSIVGSLCKRVMELEESRRRED